MPKGSSSKKGSLSPDKAKTILSDGEVRGHPLTPAQRRFMGARAGGSPMKPPSKSPMKPSALGGTGRPSRTQPGKMKR